MSLLYRDGPCDRCGQPGRRYVNAHLCPEHAPAQPRPEYAASLAGLREAAGITPPPLPDGSHTRRSLRRTLDTVDPVDTSTGTIVPDGPHSRWECGLCAVSGVTSHASAPRALEAHLRYRHPNRAAKVAERAVEAPAAPVGLDHPETSIRAAADKMPRSGTQRRAIYDLIAEAGERGMTDAELETATRGLHQSVSATRNSLMNDHLIRDSGLRRRTPTGKDAIAWVLA